MIFCVPRYNNKTYRIDDLDYTMSPESTFTLSSGDSITFVEYYKRQYNVTIIDRGQPMIVHRPKIKSAAEKEVEKLIILVPELCFLTGMTDAMRSDFRVMKDVATYTR